MKTYRNILATLLLCTQVHAQPSVAAPELLPMEDQLLRAGQLFSMVIKTNSETVGDSFDEIALVADKLPEDAVLLDNLDGSRTFMWIPESHHSGNHSLVFRLLDSRTATTADEHAVTLTIVSSDEEYEHLLEQRTLHSSTIASAPTQVATENSDTTDVNLAVASNDTKLTKANIVISETINLEIGRYFEETIQFTPQPNERYHPRILNQPDGLTIAYPAPNSDTEDYSLTWHPKPKDKGNYVLIIQLVDQQLSKVIASRRVSLVVKLP